MLWLVGLAVLILILSACGESEKYRNLDENKITVIATLFPAVRFC